MEICDIFALVALVHVWSLAGLMAWWHWGSEPDPSEVGWLSGQTVNFRTREVTLPW